jgi:hypothetical protein
VSRDASLTDFADHDGSSAGDKDGGGDPDESDSAAPHVDSDSARNHGNAGSTGSDAGTDSADAEETSERTDDGAVEPPALAVSSVTTTVEWDAAGRPCATCGEPVRRRWQDDGNLICGNCMEW